MLKIKTVEKLRCDSMNVWSPWRSGKRSVQNFAARIVLDLKKFDHISLGIKSLNWLTVKERLFFNNAVMVFKCVNDLVPEYLAKMFVPRSRIHSRVTRSCSLLHHIPQCRLSSGQLAFTYRGCKLWNNLPNDLQVAENVSDFKRRLLNPLLSGKNYSLTNSFNPFLPLLT